MGCRPEGLHPVLYPGFVLFVGSRAKGVESACRATEGPELYQFHHEVKAKAPSDAVGQIKSQHEDKRFIPARHRPVHGFDLGGRGGRIPHAP